MSWGGHDIVRGVDILLDSTSESDEIHDCLTKLERGIRRRLFSNFFTSIRMRVTFEV